MTMVEEWLEHMLRRADGIARRAVVKPAPPRSEVVRRYITTNLFAVLLVLAPLPALAQNTGVPVPTTSNQIQGNATGTTGAVVATLTAAQGKTAFICGWNVQAIGGTATVSPITIAGLQGGSQVYNNVVAAAAPGTFFAPPPFTPCLPASGQGTNITITTTADGTATTVTVQSWGFNW